MVLTGGTTLDTTLSQTITAPTKAASGTTTYYFGDWYTVDKATGHTGKTKYNYTKPVTGNITLYARWYTEQPANKAELQTLIDRLADNADLNHIDVRKVTDMSNGSIFGSAGKFQGNVSGWDVSKVTDMSSLFHSEFTFNGDISGWDVSNVTDMSGIFSGATIFNQDITSRQVSKVENMTGMFHNAKEFNQPIGAWDVSGVTNMTFMFNTTTAFDRDISGWTVTQVTNYADIFSDSGISESYRPLRFR
ncbi:BspA family leucine-rich repeat surface protein [Candidatus Haliotispira prima]|uniref:BspA family leucine-rich repeat surface protein n=1 Tax=Candidatus Haliotispira prima TaxID=3034016 RepID=A0ABY8MIS0_9SPIO|nr:BspA family leucine-rich repeat surface protein [Candidatus Haliotispira prima]